MSYSGIFFIILSTSMLINLMIKCNTTQFKQIMFYSLLTYHYYNASIMLYNVYMLSISLIMKIYALIFRNYRQYMG
jgi:hypothetical protein